MKKLLLAAVLAGVWLLAVAAFAAPLTMAAPNAAWSTPTIVSAPGAAIQVALKAEPKMMGAKLSALKAVPLHETAQRMSSTETTVAAARDVGTEISRTAAQAMLATTRPAGETTFTTQATTTAPVEPQWACGAYTFTQGTDVADVGRTMAIATTAPPTTGGQYIGDHVASAAVGSLC
ncbi:MAG: hypothetical protein WCG99_03260 [Candidatus Berkelbacteria bacterium]